MPYPYHKDQHQKFNAMPLVEARAALLATDHIDAQANMREAGPMLAALIGSQAPNATPEQAQRERLAANLKNLGPADGAATVAAQILELAK
jgi:UDP-N-acetylglucosamine:LPS N-acetylglucosamine transferase